MKGAKVAVTTPHEKDYRGLLIVIAACLLFWVAIVWWLL
jgi:hypothetical protein